MSLPLAVAGCTGRMGRAVVRLAQADPGWRLAAALTTPDDPLLGQDAGAVATGERSGVAIRAELHEPCAVLIDFTSPAGALHWAALCAERGVPLVSGVTGLSDPQRAALRVSAQLIPVLWSANMSLGIALLRRLAAIAAQVVGPAWDIEIVEAHHNLKRDAPSGTAKLLLEAVLSARENAAASTAGPAPDQSAAAGGRVVHGRSGDVGARPRGEIGMHAVRLGGVVGDHDVHFGAGGEVLTLSHRALSRDVFAAGALRAAAWLAGKPPGWYALDDVLL